jgi:hypothetical protein
MRMNVMLAAFTVLLVLFSSPLQTTRATDGPAKEYDDAEAYKIYSTILPSEWPIRIAHAKHVLIRRETRVNKMCLRPEGEFEKTVGPAIGIMFASMHHLGCCSKNSILNYRMN